jgi:nitrogen fixation protein NifU and related proteins
VNDLQELYQELIIDHSKRPRNFRPMEGSTQHAVGYNPLCGDKVTIFLRMENGRVADVSFQGSGCAISTSSASLLTESVKGKTREEVEALFTTFHRLVMEGPDEVPVGPGLGKLAVFGGVSKYPARVKCASLAWHTMKAALDEKRETLVTTE